MLSWGFLIDLKAIIAWKGEKLMTDNMFGFQINFGRRQHKKARWKKARARWLLRYAKHCENMGTVNDLLNYKEQKRLVKCE